jgi:hypothetical protein
VADGICFGGYFPLGFPEKIGLAQISSSLPVLDYFAVAVFYQVDNGQY